jgi:hypothetical protein
VLELNLSDDGKDLFFVEKFASRQGFFNFIRKLDEVFVQRVTPSR